MPKGGSVYQVGFVQLAGLDPGAGERGVDVIVSWSDKGMEMGFFEVMVYCRLTQLVVTDSRAIRLP